MTNRRRLFLPASESNSSGEPSYTGIGEGNGTRCTIQSRPSPRSQATESAAMARTTRPHHHRVRPRAAAGGEDRLSALPDELLHLILRQLDTRTALSTSVLTRRWACLPRVLPTLDFRVREILPHRCHRGLALRRRALGQGGAAAEELDALIARYERRAMRAFAGEVTSFLEADGGHGDYDGHANRRAKSLRLDFFPTHNVGCVDRLITAAVGTWGVYDLEVVVKPAPCHHHHAPAYSFPHHCL